MLDNLKKYWFVVIIAVGLVIGIVFYTVEYNKSIVSGKKVDGKDVVYSVSGKNYTADEYYNALYETRGIAEIYKLYERSVLDSISTTEDIAKKAKEDADTVKRNVSAQSGQAGLDQLNSTLIMMGYSGIDEMYVYFENISKQNVIRGEYLEAHKTDVVDPFFEAKKPRIVSHILVKMGDPANPTADEQKKLDNIDSKLAEGVAFADVAMEFSDDGSKSNGGYIGYLDRDSQFVPEFIEGSISINKGEVTGWVTSQFGRHKITVLNDSFDDLKNDESFQQALVKSNPTIDRIAIYEKGQALEFKFTSETTQKELYEYIQQGGTH